MSRAFRNGKTLAYWSKNELSRAPRSFESDLIKFSGKVWASRTASFRGQEIFPMMSGDAPRYTIEVSSQKNAIFFWDFNFGSTFQRLLQVWPRVAWLRWLWQTSPWCQSTSHIAVTPKSSVWVDTCSKTNNGSTYCPYKGKKGFFEDLSTFDHVGYGKWLF